MQNNVTTILFLFCNIFTPMHSRTIWQEQENLPLIKTFWIDTPTQQYQLRHSRLESWAIFDRFNSEELQKYMIPNQIQCDNQIITKQEISKLCQTLLEELEKKRKNKNQFTNFTVLKDADFNYKERHGNLILKFKNYPLVFKLFCETPQSFVRPFSRGIVPSFLFSMGGGINRFLAGFTRIPNLEAIKKIVEKSPKWRDKIRLPRKWYWLPESNNYFVIVGHNFGSNPEITQSIEVPGTYGIIADFIPCAKTFSIKSSEDRDCAIELETFFQNRIDPHICNFFFDSSGKIALIDTEHFATIMGLDNTQKDTFSAYHHLVIGLGNRYISRTLFQNKKERNNKTKRQTPDALCIR